MTTGETGPIEEDHGAAQAALVKAAMKSIVPEVDTSTDQGNENAELKCLIKGLSTVHYRNAPGPGPEAIIVEEIPYASGEFTCLSCEACSAGAMVKHTDWVIEDVDWPKEGNSLTACPQLGRSEYLVSCLISLPYHFGV